MDWKNVFKPFRTYINQFTRSSSDLVIRTLDKMVQADCSDLTDIELAERLEEELDKGDMTVRGSMAVMEASIRLREGGQ